MEDVCKHASVEKLVLLCAKSISLRRNVSLLCKEQFNKLFQLEFPVIVLESLLSSLPINVLLELEEKHPGRSSIFRSVWLRIFKRCQLKLWTFKLITEKYLPNDLVDELGTSEFKSCMEIFMDLYFNEVFYEYVVRCEQPLQPKIPRLENKPTLYGSLDQNEHDNPEVEMLRLALKHIKTLRFEFKHIDCIQDVFDQGNCFRNISNLGLIWRKSSDEIVLKWKSVLELVFHCTSVKKLDVKILVPCSKFKDLLQYCVRLGDWNVSLSLWDECDTADVMYYNTDVVLSYKGVLCNITELTIQCDPLVTELGHFYRELLPFCSLLKKLTALCNDVASITVGLVKGLEILCKSGHNKLQVLRIESGRFGVPQLLSLGSCLNSGSSCVKYISFDGCTFEDTSPTVCDNDINPRGPVSGSNTISCISLLESESTYHASLLLARLLQYYNPENLIVFDMTDTSDCEFTIPESSLIRVPLQNKNTRLRSISYGLKYGASYFSKFVNCMVSFVREKAGSVDLHVIYALHDKYIEDTVNKIENFKSVTLKKATSHDDVLFTIMYMCDAWELGTSV